AKGHVAVVPAGEVGRRGLAGIGDDRRGLVDLEVGAVDGGGSVAGDIGAAVGGDVHAQAFTAGRLGLPVVGQVEGSVAGRVDARQVVGDRELVDNVGLVPASQVGIRGRTLVGDDRRGLVDLEVGAVDGGGSVTRRSSDLVGGDVHAQAFTAGRLGLPVVGQVEGSVAGRVDARQVVGDREL